MLSDRAARVWLESYADQIALRDARTSPPNRTPTGYSATWRLTPSTPDGVVQHRTVYDKAGNRRPGPPRRCRRCPVPAVARSIELQHVRPRSLRCLLGHVNRSYTAPMTDPPLEHPGQVLASGRHQFGSGYGGFVSADRVGLDKSSVRLGILR